MKTIYILLTRTGSILSRAIRIMTRDPYTHVAIAFHADLQELYSAARWDGITMFPSGPCREDLRRGLYTRYRTPCALYELQVEDAVYQRAREEVARIIDHQQRYHFNIIGLALCRLGIPFRRRSHFFCSQFVGEILQRSGALELPREPCLLRPSDYVLFPQLKFCFQGDVSQLWRTM